MNMKSVFCQLCINFYEVDTCSNCNFGCHMCIQWDHQNETCYGGKYPRCEEIKGISDLRKERIEKTLVKLNNLISNGH